MATIDKHELQAWLDGELAPADAARIEAAIAADPGLAAQAERERRLGQRLHAAFDPVLDEPMPARFAALLQNPAAVDAEAGGRPPHGDGTRSGSDAGPPGPEVDGGDARPSTPEAGVGHVVPLVRPASRATRPRWSAPVYALAASLAVLAVASWLRPADGPVQIDEGALVARGELARSLDTALASEPAADADVAIGLSFRDAEGRICRSFVQRTGPALAGLACRDGDRWTLPVLSGAAEAGGGELRQAASGTPPEVQAAIDERLQGEVFDAGQERAARAADWR